jgi:hypothetical protein
MGGRKMISDDEKRKQARQARAEGKAPSEAGVTTGAPNQRSHVRSGHHERHDNDPHDHQPWSNRPRQSRRVGQ